MKNWMFLRRAALGFACVSLGLVACRREAQFSTTPVDFIESVSGSASFRAIDALEIDTEELIVLATSPENRQDLWLARIRFKGSIPTVVWQTHLGDASLSETGVRLVARYNQVYALAQQTQSDGQQRAVVYRLDAQSGALSDEKLLDLGEPTASGDDFPTDMYMLNDADVVVLGNTARVNPNKPDFDPARDTRDIGLVRLSRAGLAVSWRQTFGLEGRDLATTITQDANNNLLLAGHSERFNAAGASEGFADARFLLDPDRGEAYNTVTPRTSPEGSQTQLVGCGLAQSDGSGLLLLANTNQAGTVLRKTLIAAQTQGLYTESLADNFLPANDIARSICPAKPNTYLVGADQPAEVSLYGVNAYGERYWSYQLPASAINASQVQAARAIYTQSAQHLLLFTATINGQNQLGILRLDNDGNPIR